MCDDIRAEKPKPNKAHRENKSLDAYHNAHVDRPISYRNEIGISYNARNQQSNKREKKMEINTALRFIELDRK